MTEATDILEAPDMEAVLENEQRCAERIAFLWREADVLPGYPATTETASELLRVGGGYDAPASLLEQWARDKKVEGILIRGGRFSWTSRAILCAMILLDAWRRFLPMDRRHLHKLTAAELVEMQARVSGESGFSDLDAFDVNAVIEILARCNDENMRRVFAVALKAKLRQIDAEILNK